MTDQLTIGQYVAALSDHVGPTGTHIQQGRIGRVAEISGNAVTVYWGHTAGGWLDQSQRITTCYNQEGQFQESLKVLPDGRGAMLFQADQLKRDLSQRAHSIERD